MTCFIYHNPKLFRLHGVHAGTYQSGNDLRITLDTKEDYELICKIFEAHGDTPFGAKEIVSFLRANPELLAINRHVRQKTVDEAVSAALIAGRKYIDSFEGSG